MDKLPPKFKAGDHAVLIVKINGVCDDDPLTYNARSLFDIERDKNNGEYWIQEEELFPCSEAILKKIKASTANMRKKEIQQQIKELEKELASL